MTINLLLITLAFVCFSLAMVLKNRTQTQQTVIPNHLTAARPAEWHQSGYTTAALRPGLQSFEKHPSEL